MNAQVLCLASAALAKICVHIARAACLRTGLKCRRNVTPMRADGVQIGLTAGAILVLRLVFYRYHEKDMLKKDYFDSCRNPPLEFLSDSGTITNRSYESLMCVVTLASVGRAPLIIHS